VFVSLIPSDLLPGIVVAKEFIGGLAYELSGCRESIRLPEPESLEHPANIKLASIMLTEPRIVFIPMTSSLPPG